MFNASLSALGGLRPVVKKEPGAKVRMREICDDFRPEQQLQESPRKFQSRPRCKTESRRQCKTVFEPQASLVKVRICPGDTNDDPERQKRLQARPNAGFLRTMASLAAFTLKRTPYEVLGKTKQLQVQMIRNWDSASERSISEKLFLYEPSTF